MKTFELKLPRQWPLWKCKSLQKKYENNMALGILKIFFFQIHTTLPKTAAGMTTRSWMSALDPMFLARSLAE